MALSSGSKLWNGWSVRAVSEYRALSRKPSRLAALLAVLLTLSACAGQMGGPPLTPAQAQLKQANQRFAVTIGEGAIVGALLGAGVGYLAGGGKGAIIGAVGGGVLGAAAGYAVAQNNFSHARTEANLNSLIQEANADASAAERSAIASAQIAADLRAETARLNASYAAHSITAAQYQANISNYRDSAKTMRQQLSDMQKESATLRGDAATVYGPGAAQLNQMANRIDVARKREAASLQALDKALSAVPSG